MRSAVLTALCGVMAMEAGAGQGPQPPVYRDKARLLVYLDENGAERAITSAQEWPRRRAHILASMELVMGALPDRSRKPPLDVKVAEEAELPRFTRRKLSFLSDKEDRVPAYLFIPKGLTGKAPAMLCLHQTTPVGSGEPAGLGGDPNLAYALDLAERGYVALAPDYPNFGDYRCDPYAMGYASATMKGIWNHMRAVDLIESLPEADGGRIGVIGHSLGGHNAIFVAAFDPRIRAIVSSCGFNSFLKYCGGDLSGWSHKGYMPRIASVYGRDAKRMPFDFTEAVAALAPRPFFINAPLRDDNFGVSGVRDCVAAALPVYELLGGRGALVAAYPDAGHSFPADVRRAAYEFLDKALARSSHGGR